jgi:hypothetical protein
MIWIRVQDIIKKWIRQRLDEGSDKEPIRIQIMQLVDRELYTDEEYYKMHPDEIEDDETYQSSLGDAC